MNPILAWLAGLLALLPGFGTPPSAGYTGYVEARYVYMAPTIGGPLATLAVQEGQQVKRGDTLFTLADTQQRALLAAAVAQADAATATYENLTTGGRAEELAAAQAAVNKAQADLNLAQQTVARSQKLFASNTITAAQLDQDRATAASAEAALRQAEAQLAVIALPARSEQQKAAAADAAMARANADKARADLADLTVTAPIDGRIERTFFDPGEIVAAGAPVLSLLPAKALKVEFFVAEPDRMKLMLGETVAVACDGCPAGLAGTVSFLASDPQYTAPIIYSREERAQLVYLAEATLTNSGRLLPGQPVTVSLGK